MLIKLITIIAVLAALVAAREVTKPRLVRHSQVTISDEESYPAEDVDCEYIVTPKSIKLVKGGDNC